MIFIEKQLQTKGRLYKQTAFFYLYATQTEKDDPQPQVVSAFGLRITNCDPCKLSV